MASRDGKTEAPTEKKKRDARKKGTVSKSQDLGPWLVLLVCTYAVPMTIGSMRVVVISAFAEMREVSAQPDPQRAASLLGQALVGGLFAVLPLLLVCLAVGAVAHFAQTGLVISLHPLKPDFKRINPIQGVKRLLSVKSIWETAKQFGKGLVIAWIAWPHIQAMSEQLTARGRVPLLAGVSASAQELVGMTRSICWAVLVIALADAAFQRRQKVLDLRMTKQEVRDEMRNAEGDPHVKGRIRSMQMAMARSRMMASVADATVVVTNPTHVAVAIRYDTAAGGAPVVVASGVGAVAAKIRERAHDAGVPIIEAKPLARALWRSCDVGDEIPVVLYEAVAKVLAFVRRLRGSLLASASVLPLPSSYQLDGAMLDGLTGRKRRRLPA